MWLYPIYAQLFLFFWILKVQYFCQTQAEELPLEQSSRKPCWLVGNSMIQIPCSNRTKALMKIDVPSFLVAFADVCWLSSVIHG